MWHHCGITVASLSKCDRVLVMSRFESRVFVSCGHMCSLCRRFWGECESHSAPLIDSPVISGSFISKKMPSHLKQWKHLPPVQRFSIMCWSGFAEGWCWEGWAALRHPAAVYRSSCSDQPVTFSGITETLFSNQLHTPAELEAPGFGISDKNTWGHHFLTFPSLRPTRKWGVGAMRVSDVVFAGWLLWKRLFHPELCRFLNEAK